MILRHGRYITNTGDSNQTRAISGNPWKTVGELAKRVAEYFVGHFGFDLNTQRRKTDFLFKGENWMDAGPILDLNAAYADQDNIPLRPKPQKSRTKC